MAWSMPAIKRTTDYQDDLDEDEVNQSLKTSYKKTCASSRSCWFRVPKFQHNAEKELDLIKAERALLAELLNRGPQTTGELNNRASRMFEFRWIQMSKKPCRINGIEHRLWLALWTGSQDKKKRDGITN